MKAIILNGFGSVENLLVKELNTPAILENEVLVEVKAISINPVDVTTRAGNWLSPQFKDEDPIILGWDISGIVSESKSSLFKNGDHVFGMVNFPGHGKAYAEYVAAPANQLSLKPANISFKEAAAGALAALTAYQCLNTHYHVIPGQRILIHAASGGVGHYAIQLAKLAEAYVIGTSSAANRDFVLSLGADEHIDYHKVRFEQVLSNIDFVLETIGGKHACRFY
jgi:NADPH:quinone reductase-like Zn-dependent oxidoreductase